MPASMAADGLAKLTGLAAEADDAGVALVDAEEDAGHLGPPGADQSREADDLAGADLERDVAELADPGQALDLQQDVADRGLDLREERDGPPDHVADEVGGGQVARGGGHDVAPVAEHRRAVAQLEDLVEAVADEQDRDAAVAQPADDAEQPLDLVGGQRRGRLVEDQDARLDRERLRDLDELLVGHRQAADRGAGRRTGRRAPGTAPSPGGATRPSRGGRTGPDGAWPMNTFSATDRSGKRRGSWWTTAMPRARACAGPEMTVSTPSSRIVPLSGWWMPGQDLDEGALAGPVLADQRVDLAGEQLERDVVERLRREEPLGDAAELDARGARRASRARGAAGAVPTVMPTPPCRPARPCAAATRTPDAAPGERLDHRRGRAVVGQHLVDVLGLAERREGRALPLGVVDDRDDLARGGDHRRA